MFVYEGRTSSILSETSSANAYTTFNPNAIRPFNENRFGAIAALNDEFVIVFLRSCCSMDDNASLSSSLSVTRMTAEEKQYLQLLAMSQLGGVIREDQVETCRPPAVLINQAGSTETTGTNWLLPVAARDSYEHFFDTSLNVHSYQVSSPSKLPSRIRLYVYQSFIRNVLSSLHFTSLHSCLGEEEWEEEIASLSTESKRRSHCMVISPKSITKADCR